MKALSLLCSLLVLSTSSLASALEVSPTDPNIRYMGRWDFSTPAAPKTSYGHGIKANFTGTSVSVTMDSFGQDGIYYEYSIDGGAFQTISGSGASTFSLATGLSPGSHSLEFRRRLEASYGMSTFQGLTLDDGAILESATPPSSLQLEFIGDSITAGFGSEGPQNVTTNNINVTWAARLADKLGAERTTIARSGIGISIDVNGTELSMPKRYPDTHFTWGGATPAWDFGSWTPNGVFILLGTNDYVFGSPSPQEFESAYTNFVGTVRANYPSAHIFVVNIVQGRTTPDAKWTQASASLEAVVAGLNAAGDANVHFVDPGEGLVGSDFSDTTHPLPSGHELMANNLLALVEPILGTGSNPAPPPAPTNPAPGTGGTAGLLPATGGTTSTMDEGVGEAPIVYVDGDGNPVEVAGYDGEGNPVDVNGEPVYAVHPTDAVDESAARGSAIRGCALMPSPINSGGGIWFLALLGGLLGRRRR